MIEEIEFLKERGKEFWDVALENIDKGRYNISILHVEQALQLWLKYLIALKAGDFPKHHFLTKLIEEIIDIYRIEKLGAFFYDNRLAIGEIEDAYITSRYTMKKFYKEDLEKAIELAVKLIKLLEDATKIRFI
jgi:HEPN domain-containing protein